MDRAELPRKRRGSRADRSVVRKHYVESESCGTDIRRVPDIEPLSTRQTELP